jgi:hypothetical protein
MDELLPQNAVATGHLSGLRPESTTSRSRHWEKELGAKCSVYEGENLNIALRRKWRPSVAVQPSLRLWLRSLTKNSFSQLG